MDFTRQKETRQIHYDDSRVKNALKTGASVIGIALCLAVVSCRHRPVPLRGEPAMVPEYNLTNADCPSTVTNKE